MRRVESELRMDAAWSLRPGTSPHLANIPGAVASPTTPAPTATESPSPAAAPPSRTADSAKPGRDAESSIPPRTTAGTPTPSNASVGSADPTLSPSTPADIVVQAASGAPDLASPAATTTPAAAPTPQQQQQSVPYTKPTNAAPGNNNSGSPTGAYARSTANTAAERIFEELLDAEVAVSMGRLREAARTVGVPQNLRATVYRYLLGVASMDKSSEMTSERMQEKDVEMLRSGFQRMWGQDMAATATGRFRHDDGSREDGRKNAAGRPGGSDQSSTTRYYYGLTLWPAEMDSGSLISFDESPWANAARTTATGTVDSFTAWAREMQALLRMEPFVHDHARREKIETAMSVLYMTHADLSPEEIHYLVTMTLPFEVVCSSGRDIFFCAYTVFAVQKMFGNILQDDACLQLHCGQFLMLLRDTNLSLYNHFYAQGISTWEWVPSLLIMLLADRHMHPSDLLRLWDTYLSDVWESVGFPLHPFICLAVLSELTEELVECEKEEILYRLCHFPRLHIPGIIQRALAIRESVISRGLL